MVCDWKVKKALVATQMLVGWMDGWMLLLCFPAHQQEQLVQSGVIPRLVSIIRDYPEKDPLINVCLLALCNLVDLGNPLL